NYGQIDFEYRTVPGLAVHEDLAAALLNDAVHDGETEAGSLPLLLGGKKRFEKVRLDGFVHSTPGVAHREHRVAAGFDTNMPSGIFGTQLHIHGFNGQPTAVRH